MSEFERVYWQYRKLLWRIAYKIVKHVEVAEEIVQEVFLRYHKNKIHVEGEKQWLTTVCKHLSLDVIKGWQFRTHINNLESLDFDPPMPKHHEEDSPTFQDVCLAIAQLGARDQLILKQRYLKGVPAKQMAKEMRCSVNSVHVKLWRARSRALRYL